MNDTTAWAVGGTTILRTTDSGATWEAHAAPAGSGSLQDICAIDPSTAFAVGGSGTIIKTTDGGTSWTSMYNPISETLYSVCATDATHAFAVGAKGTVLRLVQANTRVGSDVTVGLKGSDTITFSEVTAAGNTIESSTETPTGEEFDYHISLKCVDISSSASFTGTAEVKFPYGEGLIWDERSFRMLHNTGSGWEDVTTDVDTENNILTGQVTSLSEFAFIFPLPKIKSMSPTWGKRGTTVDADLYGYGFWEASGDKPTIQLKNGEVVIDATDIVVHSLYHISCKFPLPADAALDTWDVYIMNPDDSYEDTFWGLRIVENPPPTPTVTSISPYYGARGTSVNISDLAGTGFWDAPTVQPTVKLRRVGEDDIGATGVGVYNDGTKITCSFPIPAEAYSGLWDVTVENPDGQHAELMGCFMVTGGLPAPTLTSITPNTGALGAYVDVTMEGTGFWGKPYVYLSGPDVGQNPFGSLANVVVTDGTTITCTFNLITNVKPGVYDVNVRNQDNQLATLAGAFTITSPPPAITNVSPSNGEAGTEVTLTGTAFGRYRWDSNVTFGGVPATEFPSWNITQIKVKVPAGVSGPVKVKLTTDWGESNEADFTVGTQPVVPTITTFTPTQGAAGTVVTIYGTGFGAVRGTSVVKFGTIKATAYTSWSDTQIKVKVPAPASRKCKLTVSGTGFGSTRGVSYVKFGKVKATLYPSWSNTQVKVKVPAGLAPGKVSLVLVTSGGGSVSRNFTVK